MACNRMARAAAAACRANETARLRVALQLAGMPIGDLLRANMTATFTAYKASLDSELASNALNQVQLTSFFSFSSFFCWVGGGG